MKRKSFAALGVLVVTLLSFTATSGLAQGRGQNKPKSNVSKGKAGKPANAREARPVFGSDDRVRISDYYSKHSGLPPGLAKRDGDLPPGLEKQLQRNGTLPPGLRKRLRPLPAALERQLNPLPSGFRRGILDRHLVVYRDGTYVIEDSILNVLR